MPCLGVPIPKHCCSLELWLACVGQLHKARAFLCGIRLCHPRSQPLRSLHIAVLDGPAVRLSDPRAAVSTHRR